MHLIQQNILDIECSSSSFGKEVQSSIGNIMEKEFYPKVALLLDQYSRDNYTWKIENLKIQLPTLSKKNWKEEFVQHSLLQVEDYLKLNSSYLELLEKQEIALEAIENELKSRKEKDPELALNLNADDGVQYGTVAKVMSSIERAGVTKLSVLTLAK